jgi:DNA (cytosine-5)-methyltransferase 1
MKTIYQCEWDKHANSILERHWPHVPKWGDISTLTAKEILRHGTPPDVVAWGSPCQDLSVAGKRAGLEGERSGLFHEGIRIINEIRKETNNEYPRISLWENVAGALSSNRAADFGVIIDEMAKAGAMVIEWGLLDAQHFGIPQRRRRVFLIAIFNSATASNCPNPLLPIGESLRGNPKKGKPKREGAASETSTGFGSGSFGGWTETDTAITLSARDHKGTMTIVGALAARDYKGVGSQYVDEGKVIVEPYVKSRRAQSATDDETWVPGEVNPTLNSFDVGDTRATTAIIEPLLIDGTRVDDVRVYEPPVQTLGARMGTGGNNVPVIGIQGNVIGRQPENGPVGKGHTEEGDPMFTLTGTDVHAVAYPIDTRNALRDPEKHDAQNRQGLGIGNDGDPMATLTSAHVNAVAFSHYDSQVSVGEVSPTLRSGTNGTGHAVAYDEYNDSINETHHALRAGTKQSTGVLLEGEVAGTLRSGGSGGVPSSRGEHLVAEPSMAVRRLTPLECERLMGWPDDHTRYKADGTEQADTHRYKQCGNGVASPVAEWIGKQLMKLDEAPQ